MKFRTIAFAVLGAATIAAPAQEPPPAQVLETYRVVCHDSRVYTREWHLARYV